MAANNVLDNNLVDEKISGAENALEECRLDDDFLSEVDGGIDLLKVGANVFRSKTVKKALSSKHVMFAEQVKKNMHRGDEDK